MYIMEKTITHKAHVILFPDIEKCPVPPKTKLLVLVNPYSGPGKAMQIYKTYVAPMLAEADIQVKLIQTGKFFDLLNLGKWVLIVDFPQAIERQLL